MISHSELLKILRYEPETGHWYWLKKISRKVIVGTRAGTIGAAGDGSPRWVVTIYGKKYLGHRLAFFYMTGRWPEPECDHKDTDTLNNRWSNLREANRSQQGMNLKIQAKNTSGYKNVHWNKANKKWHVQFHVNGKTKYFGLYEDIELANLVACELRDKYYGEFARHQ